MSDGRMTLSPAVPMAVHECGDQREINGDVRSCVDESGHDGWHQDIAWRWSAAGRTVVPAARWIIPASFVEEALGVERAPEALPTREP